MNNHMEVSQLTEQMDIERFLLFGSGAYLGLAFTDTWIVGRGHDQLYSSLLVNYYWYDSCIRTFQFQSFDNSLDSQVLAWFRSCLKNFFFFFFINGDYSEAKVQHGVPQGAAIAPELFFLYSTCKHNIGFHL